MPNMICFAENHNKVQTAFRDYMSHYFAETGKRTDLVYDKTISFAEKEAKMDRIMKDEIFRISGINPSVAANVSVRAMSENPLYHWGAMAIVNSLVDMILPIVIGRDANSYVEVRYGADGDSFSFDVEPNDLFYVSKAGRAQRTTEFQKQYQGTVTVVPELHMISVAVDFYKVLAGKDSLARLVTKAVISMHAHIYRDVYTAFDTALAALPTTPATGALHLTGWDDAEAIALAQRVTAFNNGARAAFLGTPLALRHILPKDANYRYFLDDDYVRLGYVREFATFSTIVMEQVANYENPYNTLLNDNRIYVISTGSQKPIKLCFEGDSRSNTMGHYDTADLSANTTLYKAWGTAVATNAIAGVIDLA